MDAVFERTIASLERNNIGAVYAASADEAVKLVKDMLPEGCTVTSGGSVSLVESGVMELLKSGKYNYLDRNAAGITAQQKQEIYRTAVGCDYYFCSSNAVTENGELVNVDGFCNRIASICFGPQRVVMIVGKNKLVKNTDEAFLRIKTVAAPKNCVRLGIDSPCAKTGKCVSLLKSDSPGITDGCDSPRRICANYVICGRQQVKNRITVILCDAILGY